MSTVVSSPLPPPPSSVAESGSPRGELDTRDEECPVCLEKPTEEMVAQHNGCGFKDLGGCSHKVCWGCIDRLSTTTHHHRFSLALNKRFLKCPLCRSWEMPTAEESVTEREFLLNRPLPPPPTHRPVQMRPANDPFWAQLAGEYGDIVHRYVARMDNQPRTPVTVIRRCQTTGCQNPHSQQRRCGRHPSTYCCQTCQSCNVCKEAEVQTSYAKLQAYWRNSDQPRVNPVNVTEA